MHHQRIPIKDAENHLCYPDNKPDYCKKLAKKIENTGITSIVSYGKTRLYKRDINILGKGWSSIVVLAETKNKQLVAIKIRRTDSRRQTLYREALFLKTASHYKIAPKTYYIDKDFIIMQPILGHTLDIIDKTSKQQCILITRRLLWKTYLLDRIGISHNELKNPYNHVLLDQNYEPYIIDYESATIKQKPKNTTQTLSALIKKKPQCINTSPEIIKTLKTYKKHPTLHNLEKILKQIID